MTQNQVLFDLASSAKSAHWVGSLAPIEEQL